MRANAEIEGLAIRSVTDADDIREAPSKPKRAKVRLSHDRGLGGLNDRNRAAVQRLRKDRHDFKDLPDDVKEARWFVAAQKISDGFSPPKKPRRVPKPQPIPPPKTVSACPFARLMEDDQ